MSDVKYYLSQHEGFVAEVVEQKIGEIVPNFNTGNHRHFEMTGTYEYVGYRVLNITKEQATRIARILTGWKIRCIVES